MIDRRSLVSSLEVYFSPNIDYVNGVKLRMRSSVNINMWMRAWILSLTWRTSFMWNIDSRIHWYIQCGNQCMRDRVFCWSQWCHRLEFWHLIGQLRLFHVTPRSERLPLEWMMKQTKSEFVVNLLDRGCSEELHFDRPAISPPLCLSFYVSV